MPPEFAAIAKPCWKPRRQGNAMVQQVLAAGMPWGDKSLNEYVNRLGQNLARSSGSQQVFGFLRSLQPRG